MIEPQHRVEMYQDSRARGYLPKNQIQAHAWVNDASLKIEFTVTGALMCSAGSFTYAYLMQKAQGSQQAPEPAAGRI
jgi:hypothetical protein